MNLKTETNHATKIFLVDDHPLVREGLARRILREPGLTVCGEAGTASEALEAIAKLQPQLVVVDISLPGRDGIDLIKEIKARHDNIQMLVLSFHDESLYGDRALRAGARGYITKHEPPDNLIKAIHRVLAGEIVVGKNTVERVLQRVAGARNSTWTSPIEMLSDRELEIFRLIGQGRQRRQIAGELHLSVKTIEAHRANIRQKLGLKNATELIQHALQFVRDESLNQSLSR